MRFVRTSFIFDRSQDCIEMSKKVLLVVGIRGFRISFSSMAGETDVNRLKHAVTVTSQSSDLLKTILMGRTVEHFEIENEDFPGRWTVVENSEVIHDSSIVRGILSDALFTPASPSPSTSNAQDNSHKESLQVVGSAELVHPTLDSDSSEEEMTVDDGSRNASTLGSGSENATTNLFEYRELPFDYKIPTYFGNIVGGKLKKGEPLNMNEVNRVIRIVAHSICPTYYPFPRTLLDISRQLVSKYSSLALRRRDLESSAEFIKIKLMTCMQNIRQRSKVTGKKKKTPNSKLLSSKQTSGTTEILDPVSYERNVQKILNLYRKNVSGEEIKFLLRLTHQGRRVNVLKEPAKRIEEVNASCPYLNQEVFLLFEMDLLHGCDTVASFREIWRGIVPKILRVAKEHDSEHVRDALLLPEYRKATDDSETASMAALHVLPLMLLRKPMMSKFFFDLREEDENLMTVAKEKPVRSTPYIVSIGRSLTIVADGLPFLAPSNATEAVACLMATHYVYNIEYAKEVRVVLQFLQGRCLNKPDVSYAKSGPINLLLRQMNEDAA